jgi:hypothetical protein
LIFEPIDLHVGHVQANTSVEWVVLRTPLQKNAMLAAFEEIVIDRE